MIDSAAPLDSNLSATDRGSVALILTVASGLALLTLLPAGVYSGTGRFTFTALSILHGILQLAALITTLLFLRARASSPRTGVLTGLTLIVVCVGLSLAGAVPITARDALIHHLAVAKWWVHAGSIHEIPWHEWSYYPMLLDLGFTALEQHGAAWAAAYYHATFLILLAGTVSIFLHRAGRSDGEAAAGFCITLTIPIAFNLATIPVVDLGLSLYSMTALAAVLIWTIERRWSWIVLAGAALGLALGTKYNGILLCVVVAPLTIIFAVRSSIAQSKVLGAVAVLSLTAAGVFLPWALKDYLWTGNPIYPLFNGVFNVAGTPSAARGLTPLELRTMLYGESWFEILLTPLRMLVLGVDEDPRRFDGVLTPILVLAVFAFRRDARKPWVLYLSLVVALYFVLSQIYAAPRVRYLAPLYGPLAALTAAGIFEAAALAGKKRTVVLGVFFAAQAAWFGTYLVGVLKQTDAIAFAAGELSTQSYYRKHLAEYPVIEFINNSTAEDSAVYLLYTGNKFYLYDRKVRSAGHNSGNDIVLWLRSGADSSALADEFRSLGITHIEMNIDILGQALTSQLTAEQQQSWRTFVGTLKPEFAHGAFAVFSLP